MFIYFDEYAYWDEEQQKADFEKLAEQAQNTGVFTIDPGKNIFASFIAEPQPKNVR